MMSDRMATDQEHLCVPLTADALETKQLRAFVVLRQLD
jgi:hypothetical protein